MTQENLVYIVCLETVEDETIPMVAFTDENRAHAEAHRLSAEQGWEPSTAWNHHIVHSVRLNP